MPYATPQDMLNQFGENELVSLTDRDNVGVVDDDLVLKALETAEGEINAYVGAKYQLPLANVPVIVRDFACDIARYRLSGAEVTETEIVRKRYQDAIKFFERVSKGDVTLGVDLSNAKATPSGSVKTSNPAKVFNDDAMAGF